MLTVDELLTEMMRELGFQRRGAKIVKALETGRCVRPPGCRSEPGLAARSTQFLL
jgi:hypothetical protein